VTGDPSGPLPPVCTRGFEDLIKRSETLGTRNALSTASGHDPSASPISDAKLSNQAFINNDDQWLQLANDLASEVTQRCFQAGLGEIKHELVSQLIIAIGKQLPKSLAKQFLLNPRGVIGSTASIVARETSKGILKVDPVGFALGIASETRVEFTRENVKSKPVEVEAWAWLIRETTVAYGFGTGLLPGAIAAQAIVSYTSLTEAYESRKVFNNELNKSLDADEKSRAANRFLKLRASYLAAGDPVTQRNELNNLANFLANAGRIILKEFADPVSQGNRYLCNLAQRRNLPCDITVPPVINEPGAQESWSITMDAENGLTGSEPTPDKATCLELLKIVKKAKEKYPGEIKAKWTCQKTGDLVNSNAARAPELPVSPVIDDYSVDYIAGKWKLKQTTAIYPTPDDSGIPLRQLKKSELLNAVALRFFTTNHGIVQIGQSKNVHFWRLIEGSPQQNFNIALVKGDKVAILRNFGEGECIVWYKENTYITDCPGEGETFAGDIIDRSVATAKTDIWVKVTTKNGEEGWVKNPDALCMSKYDADPLCGD
jgi:hypothetical protein